MATYPLNFPAKAPATQRLLLNKRQSVGQSNWSLKEQTVQTAAQWILEWSWPAMSHAQAEAISAWLDSLNGQLGTFRFYPRQSSLSTITGKTLALPGYAYNNLLSVGGWAANQSSGLRVGMFFQVGEQLLRLTEASAFADAQGRVTLAFEPQLRLDYVTNTPVNFTNPCGLFRLGTSEGIGFTLDPDKKPVFGTIGAREAL